MRAAFMSHPVACSPAIKDMKTLVICTTPASRALAQPALT